jgi:hypothetical protein
MKKTVNKFVKAFEATATAFVLMSALHRAQTPSLGLVLSDKPDYFGIAQQSLQDSAKFIETDWQMYLACSDLNRKAFDVHFALKMEQIGIN